MMHARVCFSCVGYDLTMLSVLQYAFERNMLKKTVMYVCDGKWVRTCISYVLIQNRRCRKNIVMLLRHTMVRADAV
jgi:hypothetical protein